eukprot:4034629-Prymnesium_polylepis.1
MSRTWNDIVVCLREGDHLSDRELDDLRFDCLRGQPCEAFFGAPEYVILPTALTSPVFCARIWQRDFDCFQLAQPALSQTCDLLVWLAVSLKLTAFEDRSGLAQSMHDLATLVRKTVRRESANAVGSLLNLRSSLAALCSMLLGVSHKLNVL